MSEPLSSNSSTPSLSLERPSKQRRTHTAKASANFNASAFLDAHLQEIQTHVIMGSRPAFISAKFKSDYGMDIDSKLISNKIKNWKINGRIQIPALNETNLRATDAPYPPTRCKKI